jgi:LPS sulfotransferase NodH
MGSPASAAPPTVIFVAGIGRSGSTVLGELLHRVDGVRFVGELSQFWRRFAAGHVCSCGRPLPRCPFWSAVAARGVGDLPPARIDALSALERDARPRRALFTGRRTISARTRELLGDRARLYRAIGEIAGVRWIVDTGKDPVYGAALAALAEVNVVIVHLVRDPRGVAYSSAKRLQSDSEPGEMERFTPASAAWQYALRNLAASAASRRLGERHVRLRYEDLVADPRACLARVAQVAGVPLDDPGRAIERLALPPADHHLVAGNPGVRRRGGRLRLALDEEWRVKMRPGQRRLVVAICAPLMLRYGYPLTTRRAQVAVPERPEPALPLTHADPQSGLLTRARNSRLARRA